METDVELCHL